HRGRDALAAEQRTDLGDRPAQARHRRFKRRVVQAFRELRGAGPRPSTKRPPDIAWSVAAAIAMVAALRFQMPRMPVPSVIRVVRAAASASSTVMSYAHVSGKKKPS